MSGLIKQFFASLTLPPRSAIEGRTILITGANTGLGLEAARHAARLGAGTIIMGVRSTAKGEAAKADIEASLAAVRASSINTIASFLIWPIDLSSFASVRDFAARTEEYVRSNGGGVQGRLDMAILNAGIATTQFALTADGCKGPPNLFQTVARGLSSPHEQTKIALFPPCRRLAQISCKEANT